MESFITHTGRESYQSPLSTLHLSPRYLPDSPLHSSPDSAQLPLHQFSLAILKKLNLLLALLSYPPLFFFLAFYHYLKLLYYFFQ